MDEGLDSENNVFTNISEEYTKKKNNSCSKIVKRECQLNNEKLVKYE